MALRKNVSSLANDAYIKPYLNVIDARQNRAVETEKRLSADSGSLLDFASGHEFFGLHFAGDKWIFREWAPNADAIYIIGGFSGWEEQERFALKRFDAHGHWIIELPSDALHHGDLYRLRMRWPGGSGDRIPAYARRVVQDDHTKIFNAQVWRPAASYKWKNKFVNKPVAPIIYEAHVGMAQEKQSVGTYREFKDNILPRIIDAGYNTIQLMALMEHPYYGSFGYHVSSFFAASSRFGTPEELKELIDAIHSAGIAVIMDLVHSHAVKNEVEGISRFDGTLYQYFHEGGRGTHSAWDSRCFDYGKPEVLHFLLSNCRFWLDEYHIDGYRFDGITSMLYYHHGLGLAFDSYARYFDGTVDDEAVVYLTLANKLIHTVRPDAMTIAEDVSGMPGLAAPVNEGGCGFDYRLAMGVPDCWFKLVNDTSDDDWSLTYLWHELTNRRGDEQTISYVESHDQALVGGKTMLFELMDAAMYHSMRAEDQSPVLDRGMALHKMARFITMATAPHGYLNFIGNEFGHPEWIDFPREGNGWSYKYARRQWSLRDNQGLKFHFLADFDKEAVRIIRDNRLITDYLPVKLLVHDSDKVIAFARGEMFFFFNFHPSQSFVDYAIEVPPGEYDLLLNTDETRFNGQGRILDGQKFFTDPVTENKVVRNMIRLYLPCRTAMVLKRKR